MFFISSPSDVYIEREAVRSAIEFLNRFNLRTNGFIFFNPLTYENLVPPALGELAQITVDRYMQKPDEMLHANMYLVETYGKHHFLILIHKNNMHLVLNMS